MFRFTHCHLVRLFLFVSSLFLLSVSLKANNTIDSLLQIVDQYESLSTLDSTQIVQYRALIRFMNRKNDERLLEYANKFINKAKNYPDPYFLSLGYQALGFYYGKKGDHDKAISYFEQYEKTTPSIYHKINALQNLNVTYSRMGVTDKVVANADKAIQLATESQDPGALSDAYSMKATLLKDQNKIEEAILLQRKSLYYGAKDLSGPEANYAIGLMQLGNLLINTNISEAIDTLKRAEILCKKNQLDRVLVFVHSELTSAYSAQGDYQNALTIAYEALDMAERQDEKVKAVDVNLNIGDIHRSFDNFKKSEQHYMTALNVSKEIEYPSGEIAALLELGYLNRADISQAESYLQNAIQLSQKTENTNLLLTAKSRLGHAYMDNNQIDDAFAIFSEASKLTPESKDADYYEIQNGMGQCLLYKKRYNEAINYSKTAYEYAKQNGQNILLKTSSKVLYESYKGLSNSPKALAYLEDHKFYSDSLLNASNIKKITSLQLNNQFDKEKEIMEIKQAKESAILKASTRQSRIIAGSVGLLALLSSLFFWNARRKNKLIAKQNQKLESLNQTKDRLFTIIGHDLKKPTISFQNFTRKINYLLDKKDYQSLQRFGKEVETQAYSLHKLTDNLLNWALTQKEVMPYNPTQVSISDVVNDNMLLFKDRAADKQIKLISTVSESITAHADLNSLQTILRNLIDNAIKYSESGDEITVSATPRDEMIILEVKDTGVGMTPEQTESLFLLQKNKSTKGTQSESGTGLGMYIINALVELNKGKLAVQSRINEGTSFNISLPA